MFLSLLLFFLNLFLRTGGYYFSVTAECITSSREMYDVELIYTHYCNKDPYARFNSTVGKFVGLNDYGEKVAERWNNSPGLQQLKAQLDGYCKPNLLEDYTVILDKAAKPKIRLRSEPEDSDDQLEMLVCSVYDFYPPAIDVYWLRDNEKVATNSIFTEENVNGDWYYQIHSHIEFKPKSGEKVSCVVEHISSKEPIVYHWDPTVPDSERSKIAVGASGLALGIVLSGAGFIYYKKKSSGQIRVTA